jgi:hypothetical protein
MKHLILAVAVVLAAGAAQAQNTSPPSLDTALGSVSSNRVREGYAFGGSHSTPTMERQKRARAIALRREAFALQEADGGSLSKRNAEYIRRKAQKILEPSYAPAGSNITN